MIINSFQDIRRLVSDQIEYYDMSCYKKDFDELVELVAVELVDEFHNLGWRYGDEAPTFTQEQLDKIIDYVDE